MSLSKKFVGLGNNLELLYEKVGDMERELILASDAEIKFSTQKKIQQEKNKIREMEAQYCQLLPQEVVSFNFDEKDAHDAVVWVTQIVELARQNNSFQYPEQVIQWLNEVLNKLKEPGKSYSDKLKAAIRLFPAIISYEKDQEEFDTKGIVHQIVPMFIRIFKNSSKKKPSSPSHSFGPITEPMEYSPIDQIQQKIEKQSHPSHSFASTTEPIEYSPMEQIQEKIEVLETIIDDARYNPNLKEVRERFRKHRRDVGGFISEVFGSQEARNLLMISPSGETARSRFLNETVQTRNYLVSLSRKLK